MATIGSVTRLLGPLQAGDPAAAQQLWERCFGRLVVLARQKLRGVVRRAADEEDVALSAFDNFCRAAEAGRFPRLDDRDCLWRLLITITARKAARLRRDADRHATEELTLEQVLSHEPDPALAAEMAEHYQHLLHRLGDKELQEFAVRRMEGCTVEEIANRRGCAPRTVKRKLQRIRLLWEREAVS
jgi:DNA-directed RNA polymerase specialized sigma24 family protein